ncbi:SNF2 family N-terminal domain-containing protein [Astrocystis sublimbata]|nr:SNF2 family N-terminal domain-containing protein [Astrocystis sublimbata]
MTARSQAMQSSNRQKRQHSSEVEISNLTRKSRRLGMALPGLEPTYCENPASYPSLGISLEQTEAQFSERAPLSTGTQDVAIEPGIQKICYGMLYNIPARLKWIPKDSQEAFIFRLQGQGGNFIPLRLVFRQTDGVLETEVGQEFAVIDYRTHNSFAALRLLSGLEFHCIVEDAEWNEATRRLAVAKHRSNKTDLIKFQVVLTGQKDVGTSVAKILATAELYLQDPIDACWGPYENPQSLSLPNQLRLDSLELESLFPRELTDGLDQWTNEANAESITETVIEDPDSLLEMIPAHTYLCQPQIDASIIVKLLSHQQTGVDFINRREREPDLYERTLWERSYLDNGDEYFQHIITGAKSRSPTDCLGGIIADEMGLGKTLTMLSSIVGSIKKATEFCGGGGNRAKSTIVVVPSELLLNTWANEVNKHIYPGTVRLTKYHGPARHEVENILPSYDIILTTFGTIMAEHRKRKGPLYKIMWFRLVLDEAHMIRNPSSKQFKAVKEISSRSRWCLTGTPIQNSLDDMASLVRFLRVPILEEGAILRRYMTRSQSKDPSEQHQNLQLLLGCICLRRNKSVLPNLGIVSEDRRLEFTPQEREQYRGIELAFRKVITLTGARKGLQPTHHKIMEALLQLRMFCNNGLETAPRTEMLDSASSDLRPDEVLSIYQQCGQARCWYCSCDITSISQALDSDVGYLTTCQNFVCNACMSQYRAEYHESQGSTCPICRSQHTHRDLSHEIPDCSLDQRRISRYSSKVSALVQDVEEYHLRDKCVIFAFWKKTLDIVQAALNDQHITCSRIDGNMLPRERSNALIEFQSRNALRVLLMTFSTGSVGLNGLTVANRVHIIEPQWNPAVEKQAIGRLLRLDQEKPVTVIRYTMQKSIEELVQSRQFRKLELAKGGFADDNPSYEEMMQYLEQLGEIFHFSCI